MDNFFEVWNFVFGDFTFAIPVCVLLLWLTEKFANWIDRQ